MAEDGYQGLHASASSATVISNPSYIGPSASKEDLLRPLDYSKSVKRNQYVAGLCATMAAGAFGTILGYSSPVLAQLEEELTKSERSWVASLLMLGAFFGGITGGPLNVRFGRRITLILIMIPFLVGCVLLTIGVPTALLYIGRLLAGFSTGAVCVTAPTYIAEIAEPSIRGMLGSWFQLLVTVGILAASVVGIWAPWRWMGVFCAIMPALTILAMFFIAKETPADCVIKSLMAEDKGNKQLAEAKRSQALESLRWLRGNEHDIERELQEVEQSVMSARASSFSMGDLKNPGFYKPLTVSLGLMVFQQLSGINAVISYTTSIFESAGASLDGDLASVLVMLTQVLATLLATFIVDRAGRKPLLYASCILEVISLALLGYYFYVKDAQKDFELADKLGVLPVVSLIAFIFAFSIGYGPLPWVLMGELFGDDMRAPASSMATALNWFCAFIVTQTFESLQVAFHSYGTFWFFAAFTSLSVPFLFFLTPETKGKTLDEIQKAFQSS